MNREEIDYWLRYFSNYNHGFMSEDGKKITLFKMFQELKELQYLLKIKNDYIKELQQENQGLKSILVELEETIKNKIKGFKEDKDYFIDEKDMYELDNLIQKLKEDL